MMISKNNCGLLHFFSTDVVAESFSLSSILVMHNNKPSHCFCPVAQKSKWKKWQKYCNYFYDT